jgi:phage tail tape-measure protein
MAITVAELLVEIGVDAKAAEKAADGLTKKLKNTEGAAGGAAKGVGKTTKEIDKLGKTSERAGKLAGGLAKVIKGVGVGIAALGTATLTTGATFEKLRAQLKTATGSAEGAEEALGFVREFAKNTPFQVEEITGAFIKLTNLGLAPSEEALTAYGDTASAMGKDLDQLIEAVADATTGEFERLKEFGIKAKSEGDNVSFTFRGVTTTVGKNAAEIEKFLIGHP